MTGPDIHFQRITAQNVLAVCNLSETLSPPQRKMVVDKVEAEHFLAGSPLTIVAGESAGSSERISAACRTVYDQIEAVLFEKLVCCGLLPEIAAEQARHTLACLEGGIILSRVHQTADSLRAIARYLLNSLSN